MNNEGMTLTIRSMMTDDYGELLVGIEHGITAEMVLTKLHYKKKSTDNYEWHKLYNHATNGCNRVMDEITRSGYIAGGMSRNPTYYFIAREGNKREEGLILYKKVKNTTGRIKAVTAVGKNMIDTKKLSQAVKFLEGVTKKLEQEKEEELSFS